LMSTVFDEVEGRLLWRLGASRSECGRAWWGHLGWNTGRWEGGAVKAGPSGPPGGEALRAPVVQLAPATIEGERRLGVPGRLVVGGHSGDLTIGAQSWAGQAVGFGCRPFLRPDGSWCMVCSGHSQAGCTQFTGLARRGPRRSSSSRLGCVRTVLNRPPGPGSGSRRLAARRR
jgi:hypothetical protein